MTRPPNDRGQGRKPLSSAITAEDVRERFDYCPERGVLIWRYSPTSNVKAGDAVGARRKVGRPQTYIRGRKVAAHRLIWLHQYGELPEGDIDHIDGDPTNNRLSNLRNLTHAENCQNQRRPRSDNQLGVLGVARFGKRYKAVITLNGISTMIGAFDTTQEAHAAYVEAKRRLHPGNTL